MIREGCQTNRLATSQFSAQNHKGPSFAASHSKSFAGPECSLVFALWVGGRNHERKMALQRRRRYTATCVSISPPFQTHTQTQCENRGPHFLRSDGRRRRKTLFYFPIRKITGEGGKGLFLPHPFLSLLPLFLPEGKAGGGGGSERVPSRNRASLARGRRREKKKRAKFPDSLSFPSFPFPYLFLFSFHFFLLRFGGRERTKVGQKEAWEGGREGGRRDLPKEKVFFIRH